MDQETQADLREAYNRAAGERERVDPPTWKQEERSLFLAQLRKQGKRTLLEIGSGNGKDALFFQQNGLEVVCTDLSPEMVQRCHAKGLTAYEMDCLHLDFPAGSFDVVYSFNCLLHIPKVELPEVLGAIRNLLRPGGLFYYGVLGGKETEGIYDGDSYCPKRFFALQTDEQILGLATTFFDLLSFRALPLGEDDLHIQAMILRRPQAAPYIT